MNIDYVFDIAQIVSVIGGVVSVLVLVVSQSLRKKQSFKNEIKNSHAENDLLEVELKSAEIEAMVRRLEKTGAFSNMSSGLLTDEQVQEVARRLIADVLEVVEERNATKSAIREHKS